MSDAELGPCGNVTTGECALAVGCGTTATAPCSLTEGENTVSVGRGAHAEGFGNTAGPGNYAHAEGESTAAIGRGAHAEGNLSLARESYAHAEGLSTSALGPGTHTEGSGTVAGPANYAHAEGVSAVALGAGAHAEGTATTAIGEGAHAEGNLTLASGIYAHAEGQGTSAAPNTASGRASHAEGQSTNAGVNFSHAEGLGSIARGFGSHAEGTGTTASGEFAHAEGVQAIASGSYSHAEGSSTATGGQAHAEGGFTMASSDYAHSEGAGSRAIGYISHAEGVETTASGYISHAEGATTTASGYYSHAEGIETSTNGHAGAHIMGSYGSADADYSWFVANGTSPSEQGLAAKLIGSTGDMFIDGVYGGPASNHAQLFETGDGRVIEPGYFVTLAGRKLVLADAASDYILGVTTVAPGFLGNTAALHWQGKYLTDEWGRQLQETVRIPAITDGHGKVLLPEREEIRPRLNPAWVASRPYVPRSARPEWVAVGIAGQLRVRDDGTCRVDGYCVPSGDGIATAAAMGYRVLDRLGSDQILILVHGPLRRGADAGC